MAGHERQEEGDVIDSRVVHIESQAVNFYELTSFSFQYDDCDLIQKDDQRCWLTQPLKLTVVVRNYSYKNIVIMYSIDKDRKIDFKF